MIGETSVASVQWRLNLETKKKTHVLACVPHVVVPACPPVAAVVPLLPVLAPDVVWAPFDEVVELSEEEGVWAPFWLVDAASGLVV